MAYSRAGAAVPTARQDQRLGESLGLLITTPGPDERLSPMNDAVLAVAMTVATTDAELEDREVAMWQVLAGSRFPFDEAGRRAHVRADVARGTNLNSSHAIAVFSTASRLEALADVRVPTVIVQGTEDPIFPVDHGESLAKAIAGSTLITWEGVGHEVPLELADELVTALLANIAAAS